MEMGMFDGAEDYEEAESEDLDKEELEIALYSQIHFEASDVTDTPYMEENLRNDQVSDRFNIDVQGNDKTGFQAKLTTADYITNELISNYSEHSTKLEESSIYVTDSNKGKSALNSEIKTVQERIVTKTKPHSQDSKWTKALKKSKANKLSLAEKLILMSGSASESDSSASDSDLDASEDDSDEDLIDLDVDDSEDDTGLFVNVSKNQRPLLETKDLNEWTVDTSDLPSYTSTFNRSRYYRPINVRCHNCDKVGHLSKNCPEPKKAQTCGFCSEVGHHMKICPDAFCYNCEEPGHIAKECRHPKRKWYTRCSRCSMQGHNKLKCPDQWRQFHKTVNGKKLIKDKRRRPQRNTFCYNCAGDDHLGHECEEDRMDRYSKPSYPFICKYLCIENDNYSKADREGPCSKELNTHARKKQDFHSKSDKKTCLPHAFVNKEKVSDSTGRNNFDNLLFSSSNSTTDKFDSVFSTTNDSDFRFGFKRSPIITEKTKGKVTEPGNQKGAKKRKHTIEGSNTYKKQKMLDSSKRNSEFHNSSKSGKRSIELGNEVLPKRQKVNDNVEASNLDTISVMVTNEVSTKHKDKLQKGQKKNKLKASEKIIINKPSNNRSFITSAKKESFLKKDKVQTGDADSKPDTYSDEVNIRLADKEEDFPRGSSKKTDSYCDEICVTFANNLTSSTKKTKSDRGFLKSKNFQNLDSSELSRETNDDHQVFHNEWWFKKGVKRRKANKKGKVNN